MEEWDSKNCHNKNLNLQVLYWLKVKVFIFYCSKLNKKNEKPILPIMFTPSIFFHIKTIIEIAKAHNVKKNKC